MEKRKIFNFRLGEEDHPELYQCLSNYSTKKNGKSKSKFIRDVLIIGYETLKGNQDVNLSDNILNTIVKEFEARDHSQDMQDALEILKRIEERVNNLETVSDKNGNSCNDGNGSNEINDKEFDDLEDVELTEDKREQLRKMSGSFLDM